MSIYAPYWMINSTGIPLVFKQDAVPHEMAGQFDEHEVARSLTPLLFSFSDRDAPTRYVLLKRKLVTVFKLKISQFSGLENEMGSGMNNNNKE